MLVKWSQSRFVFFCFFIVVGVCILEAKCNDSCEKQSVVKGGKGEKEGSKGKEVTKEKEGTEEKENANEQQNDLNSYCSSGNNTDGECKEIESELLLIQVVFRHGDRNPLFEYPKDPHLNRTSPISFQRKGILTKLGMAQGYELGAFLATRYEDFLRNTWIPEDIFVQSSQITRTMETAQTCLAGLFPPFCSNDDEDDSGCPGRWSSQIKWQPIPVYQLPPHLDNKIRLCKKICPAYSANLEEVLDCDLVKKFLEKHESIFKYIEEQTGYSEINISSIGQIHDTLHVEAINGLELPEWTKKVYPEPMTSIENLGFQLLSGNEKLRRLNGGPLLTDVIENMKRRKNLRDGERPKKVYLYSGHDTTVSGFLAVLGTFETHQPAYTSAVIVELHRLKEKNFIVKVFYRNETGGVASEITIPDCGNPCHLDKLESGMSNVLISDKEWFQECHLTSVSNTLTNPLTSVINFVKSLWNRMLGLRNCGCSKTESRKESSC